MDFCEYIYIYLEYIDKNRKTSGILRPRSYLSQSYILGIPRSLIVINAIPAQQGTTTIPLASITATLGVSSANGGLVLINLVFAIL